MAFVAVKPSGPLFLAKAENKGGIDKLRQNHAELFRSKMTLPGPEREGGPVSAAEEDYAKRAFPGTDIPIALRRNAHAAWANARARAAARSVNSPDAGTWTLAGPSIADAPNILTFSGAEYVTSGRITALAIYPNCNIRTCRVWAAAAGGGVWRTTNALRGNGATWTFVSGSFATNAIGTLTYDAASNTLYAGTGEPNASGDSEAGFGIYKSTDGGNTWTHLAANTTVPTMPTSCGDAPAYTGPAFDGRAISSIIVRGSTMYVGSTRAVRGVSSVTGGGVTLAPGLPPYGLFKSTNGGANFTLLAPEGVCLNPTLAGDAGKIQATFGSARGVNDVEFDPNYATNSTLYAAAFPRLTASGGGVWRSTDDGANWTQIKTALAANNINDRAEFAVTLLGSGTTRMYVGDGNTGSPAARFYRSDDGATGSPTFTDMTTSQNIGYCTGQCWYDNVVYSPPGKPDVVYLGGSFCDKRPRVYPFGRCGCVVHRYDLGRNDKSNSARHVLSAESDRAKRSAPGQSCDRRDPGDQLSNLRWGWRSHALERGFRRHLIPVHHVPRSQRRGPGALPTTTLGSSNVSLQSQQGTIDHPIPEPVSCCG